VDSHALTEVSAVLGSLGQVVAAAEDDLLSCLVVMGEPDPQRSLDGWVDQVVDLLRAVDEVTTQHRATIARATARQPEVVDAPASRAAETGPSPGSS
jgi:hypothetical protein